MKITKAQLRNIIKEELEEVMGEESDSWDLEPEEAADAAEHAIEIIGALKDVITDSDEDSDEEGE
tara:strand:- start:1851 stop:2045 length:195 start_codon:yes stop_codon:yes gene_type:complete